ncbi:hypothetical protein QWY90_09995 [Flavobacterium paronense]|uniref:Uncharacterized protein n=1 Tax=Flavobacterium paronense TaxID=1392775 RepID=A0ABV5GBP5_9FLAO|nr:hypothetical protein [Flavobacterium paronense]MDN3677647.1 hypothetical protein [Flavobacterium paronense]
MIPKAIKKIIIYNNLNTIHMKKIVSMMALAAILFSVNSNAQAGKPRAKQKAKTEKTCSAAEMKKCAMDKKMCTAAEMKNCPKERKAACCAAKTKS